MVKLDEVVVDVDVKVKVKVDRCFYLTETGSE